MELSRFFLPITATGSLFINFFLILGIWHQHSLSIIPTIMLIGAIFFAAYFNYKKLIIGGLFSFLVGAILCWHQKKRIDFDCSALPSSFYGEIKEKTLTGNPYWPFKTKIKVKANKERPSSFSFYIYTKQEPLLDYNDYIKCNEITIKAPRDGDFKNYLYRHGIIGTVFIDHFNPELIHRPKFSIQRWLEKKQERIFKTIKEKMPQKTFAFFSSLFMGDKNRVKHSIEQQKTPFKLWGISHHLARSGLHLVLFIFLWHFLMSLLPFSFNIKTIILVALSGVYFLLTPTSISFIRALELFLFYKLCILCDRQINSLHLVCIVCSLTLLWNPILLFSLDFQLSFYLTFCLAWLAHLDRQKKFLAIKSLS